jgi:hypothetical protein
MWAKLSVTTQDCNDVPRRSEILLLERARRSRWRFKSLVVERIFVDDPWGLA